jgi:hypothetical protein
VVGFLVYCQTEVLNVIWVGKYFIQLLQLSKLQLESAYPKNRKKKEIILISGLCVVCQIMGEKIFLLC